LSHAFHAMSDLMVDFGTPPPREVRARPYVYQQVLSSTIPIHASISVETTHTHRAPQTQTNAPASGSTATPQPQPAQAPPRPRRISPHEFIRHVARPQPTTAGNPQAAPTTNPTFHGWRAAGTGAPPAPTQNPPAPRASVQMLHPEMLVRGGHPHPFGRLPLAMASQGGWTPVNIGGQMHPMSLFMEVRSNNNQQEEQQASRGQSPTSLGEFDDFLPCHSRHISRSSSSRPESERARPRPVVVTSNSAAQGFPAAASTNQARQPGAQSTAVPTSVDEFMNEMFRQVYSDIERARKNIKFNILGDGQ
jgi:hypothetical protein